MSEVDYVFVGGGINALVAAAMLGKKGRTTLVLERSATIGGCLRTEEVTAPGFLHDVMATTLVLLRTSPAYQALGPDLEARGFAFADTNLPTAVLRPDGSSVLLSMDRARNVKTFEALAEGDGRAFAAEMDALGADAPFLFALLGGSLWSSGIAKTIMRELWRRGPRNLAAWFGEALAPARGYLEATYRSDAVRDLWAPWVLHTGLGPESAYSAAMVKVIAFAIRSGGLSDRGRRRQDAASGLRAADCRSGRRGAIERGRRAHHAWPRLARERRRACGRRNDHCGQGRDLIDCARAALQQTAPGLAHTGASGRPGWPESLSAWQGRHADPLCAERPATLARRSGSRQSRAHPSDKRAGRRVARGERGRTRPPAG